MWREEDFKQQWRAPIVEEIHKIRAEHAARFNYDIRAIVEDLRKRQYEGDHKVVSLPPRRLPVTDERG